VVLYEMLLGIPPFDGADSYSIGYKHVHEQVVPPEVVDSRTPPQLNAIIMKCMAKNAGERYQRGNDLSDALIAYLGEIGAVAERRISWLSRRSGATPLPR
jgi:serine/threonine-protein kinase